MSNNYEQILFKNKMPVRVIVHRINHFDLHWHEYTEFLYVVKGSANIYTNGKTYALQQGQFLLISGTEIHSIHSLDPENLLVAIQIDDFFFSLVPDLKKHSFRLDQFMLDQRNTPAPVFTQITDLFKQVVWVYNKQPKGYHYQISALVYDVLSRLVRADYFSDESPLTNEQNTLNSQIHLVLDYIHDHYTEDLSLKDISDSIHVSYHYLSHTFHAVTGISFREYLASFRVKKAAEMLETTRDPLLHIALATGFSTEKSLSAAFRKFFGFPPGEYRRNHQKQPNNNRMSVILGSENTLLYESFDEELDLSHIYSLMRPNDDPQPQAAAWREDHVIEVHLDEAGSPLRHHWSLIGSCGRASDLLRSEMRDHVRKGASHLGYRYFRFHGIFCDEMMVFNRRVDGMVEYNWIYVDQILDFLLSIGLKPFLELSFTPSEMASSSANIFWWQANISKPDLKLWSDMVYAFFRHCMDRYGRREVATWYAEVWNEPDYTNVFWEGTLEDYLALYKATVEAVKRALPEIRVGGPTITSVQYSSNQWMTEFVSFCTKEQVPMDFVSFHIYGERPPSYTEKKDSYFPMLNTTLHLERDSTIAIISTHQESLRKLDVSVPEYHVTEWNVSSKPRFPIRDTAFMAPYLIHSSLLCCDMVNSLAFWTISDLIEETKAPIAPFHGGLGLISIHGIAKPSFWALYFLHQLGDEVILRGESYIVTRRDDCYQLLMYNLAYLDQLAQEHVGFSSSFHENPYYLFEEKPSYHFHFQLHGLEGRYQLTRYELNPKCGSGYDAWRKAGAPMHLDADMLTYLRAQAFPRMSTNALSAQDGQLVLDCFIPIHGCQLVLLRPIYHDPAESS